MFNLFARLRACVVLLKSDSFMVITLKGTKTRYTYDMDEVEAEKRGLFISIFFKKGRETLNSAKEILYPENY